MNALLSMGGYAPFIWSAYGFFFITIIILFITNPSPTVFKYDTDGECCIYSLCSLDDFSGLPHCMGYYQKTQN